MCRQCWSYGKKIEGESCLRKVLGGGGGDLLFYMKIRKMGGRKVNEAPDIFGDKTSSDKGHREKGSGGIVLPCRFFEEIVSTNTE